MKTDNPSPLTMTTAAAHDSFNSEKEYMTEICSTGKWYFKGVTASLLIALPVGAQSVSPHLFHDMGWRLIRPFRAGRVVAVAGVPGGPTTFYFGSVDGGVWKTTDAGTVWL